MAFEQTEHSVAPHASRSRRAAGAADQLFGLITPHIVPWGLVFGGAGNLRVSMVPTIFVASHGNVAFIEGHRSSGLWESLDGELVSFENSGDG